jgi:hypothetical protein
MDIAIMNGSELLVEEHAEESQPADVVRELSSLELALIGGGTANVSFL